MEIKVNNCCNCPFKNSSYDEYSLSYDFMDICNLSKFYNHNNYIIRSYNMDDYDNISDVNIPKWCILKKENIFNIKLI